MKILCVSQRYSPAVGGAEKVAETLMDFLSQRHDVVVYTTNAYDLKSFWDTTGRKIQDESNKNYEIRRYEILTPEDVSNNLLSFPLSIAMPGPFCPQMWQDLINMNENFDLIVATALPYNHIIPAFLASKKYNIPLIIIPHLHLEFPELYLKGLWITILAQSDFVVVNTESEKKALLSYNISSNKIHVIPPGIGIKIQEDVDRTFRQKLKVKEDSIIILFAGTKSYEKGVINLIESLKILWKDYDNLELVMIGSTTPEFEVYVNMQDKNTLNHIHDLGLVSDKEKEDIFSSCDIFAMPSKSESFGITYLEAWKYKKPVIGCKINAVQDVIDDGINGFLVDFGDHTQLSNAIKLLLDPTLRSKFGESGTTKLYEKFDSQKTCSQFEKICLSLK